MKVPRLGAAVRVFVELTIGSLGGVALKVVPSFEHETSSFASAVPVADDTLSTNPSGSLCSAVNYTRFEVCRSPRAPWHSTIEDFR